MAKLLLHLPDGSTRDIKLEPGRMAIGRRVDNDICLPFPAVSADHAAVVTVQADSFLHDLGSTNGTIVNGNRITKHFLRDHDKIDIGRQHLVFLMNEAEAVDPLPPDVLSRDLRDLTEHVRSARSNREHGEQGPSDTHERNGEIAVDAHSAPADDLLADLLEMDTSASAAVDMPPVVSIVATAAPRGDEQPTVNGNATAQGVARIKVLSGPNAGQTTAMTKPEFVFGKQGVQIAAIRCRDNDYHLVALHQAHRPSINGLIVEGSEASLTFGDTIDIGGVKLRFDRST